MPVVAKAPPHPFQSVHWGTIQNDPSLAQYRIDSADPEKHWGLGIAQVVEVDYEGFTVTLRVLMGAAGDDDRAPIPMTFPGAGARHFLGAMPVIGDYCVVGWMPQESLKQTTKTPVILAWVVPGMLPGREWHTTSVFSAAELDQGSQRERDILGGTYNRIRHKLRHMHPGNVVAYSAQGADLILDESAGLANRRGNEFWLRDQDQAAVTRALQRFDALAGVRAYHGMVQRDAQLLSPTMVSDGYDWAAGKQRGDNGKPIPQGEFPADEANPAGFLTPTRTMGKMLGEDGRLVSGLFTFDGHIDPYNFLRRGGFIDESGFVVNPRQSSDGIYGGKAVYRVAAGRDVNAAIAPGVPTLTEYRVEITHTTDGKLPVTEQTDGFDAERLPLSDPQTPGGTPNAPFIEHVMGSVVGNDWYTDKGRKAYGLPLIPKVFSGDVAAPRLDPAPLSVSERTDSPPPDLGEHGATLFLLRPLDGSGPTWWSVNKKGQWKGVISGPRNEASVELAVNGGLTLGISGRLKMLLNGGFEFVTKSKASLHLQSEEGPVTIYGGGPVGGGEAKSAQARGKEDDIPSVDIHGRTSTRIRAGRKVILKGQIVETRSKKVAHKNVSSFDIDAADGKVNIKAETIDVVCSAKRKDEFSGPKNFNPTAGPLHERSYTPAFPGLVAEKVSYTWGDREEQFNLGNHTTTILIGNATYRTFLGVLTLQGVLSQMTLGATGIAGTAPVGNVTLTALAGTATMSALAGVAMVATAGVATVRGSLGVVLSGPIYGPDVGPILCAGTLEPFTMLPFATWGLGAKGHLVTP